MKKGQKGFKRGLKVDERRDRRGKKEEVIKGLKMGQKEVEKGEHLLAERKKGGASN